MNTLGKQTSLFIDEEINSSKASHLSNNTVSLKKGLVKKNLENSGKRCIEQLNKFRQVGNWAKVFSGVLIQMDGWFSTKCKLTWKLKATKSSRFYFHLYPSILPIKDQEFSLLRTPTCEGDAGKRGLGKMTCAEAKEKNRTISLSRQIQDWKNGVNIGILPTITTINSTNDEEMTSQESKGWIGMLPTPRAVTIEESIESWDNRKKRMEMMGKIIPPPNLHVLAMKGMLPTPTTMDSTKNGDMTAAAKMMKGANKRSSGQQIQKSLTDSIHMEILKNNPELLEELASRDMLKRTKLPTKQEFQDWITKLGNAKELSQKLGIKFSTVEHWFRKGDNFFSYPSLEDWSKIKEIYNPPSTLDFQMTYQESIEWIGMLPTPRASEWEERRNWKTIKDKVENGGDVTLTTLMKYNYKMGILPKHNSDDLNDIENQSNSLGDDSDSKIYNSTNQISKTSHLSPFFVLDMMGFPTDWTLLPFLKVGEDKLN